MLIYTLRRTFAVAATAAFILVYSAFAAANGDQPGKDVASGGDALLLTAKRIFDGVDFRTDQGVLVAGTAIVDVGPVDILKARAREVINLGDATILPGFVELHAHMLFKNVPRDVVLKHGVTTIRDLGGPLSPASGGVGSLRVLTAGPIITVQKGYPISVFGKGLVAESVSSPEEARSLVGKLVEGGAAIIKIALEPGGEAGAPWSQGHHSASAPPWPMATLDIVSAIVEESHRRGKIVTAHIGEGSGASIALAAGVDEWAHVPCSELDDALIERAARQKIKVVTTLDTLSHCPGLFANARKLSRAGVSLLYGAEIAHTDVPWGVDAQELELMRRLTEMSEVEVLRAATSESGKELGMEPLGRLATGAPADIIAVRGDPVKNFKLLEYPDLVISGGKIVLNNFSGH